jgi:hypothetical protein
MTPLELLRKFLQATPLSWVEHFNPEQQMSLISVYGAFYTYVYFFDKHGRLTNGNGTTQRGQDDMPNVPAETEAPFGGAIPKLPDGFKI